MKPDRLTARIAVAFVAVGLTTLLAVSTGVFVVLRDLHREATQATLADLAQPLVTRALQVSALRDPAAIVADLRADLRPEVAVHLQLPGGRIVGSDVVVDVGDIGLDRTLRRGEAVRGVADGTDGRPHLFAATVLRAAGALTDPGVLFVTTPDRSAAEALRDLARALPLVVLVSVLLAAPIAWLLARSVVRPLRRLAAATADVPLRDGSPLPLEGPAEVRDLTDRFNAMTAELDAIRAEEADLVAGIRHDLRTPLTVIGGFAQALEDGTATGDDAARAARAIADEAARMARLVDGLGTLERIGAGADVLRPETLGAAALVTAAVERFANPASENGIVLRGDAPDGLSLTADRDAVERILANLVTNAIASLGDSGGRILVHARPAIMPAGTVGTSGTAGAAGGTGQAAGYPAVALRVSDDGPGFPAGSIERIFDRFYRADPSRAGTGSGLGLAIVRALARAHGGDAVAENLAPSGARVTVILPVVPVVPRSSG